MCIKLGSIEFDTFLFLNNLLYIFLYFLFSFWKNGHFPEWSSLPEILSLDTMNEFSATLDGNIKQQLLIIFIFLIK